MADTPLEKAYIHYLCTSTSSTERGAFTAGWRACLDSIRDTVLARADEHDARTDSALRDALAACRCYGDGGAAGYHAPGCPVTKLRQERARAHAERTGGHDAKHD